ncbi:MAG: hypothetical protein CL908_04380 [Deltaproteobacteria bacterium]|nr:hypothetical protein [Deltaproteobacteria bacterium]
MIIGTTPKIVKIVKVPWPAIRRLDVMASLRHFMNRAQRSATTCHRDRSAPSLYIVPRFGRSDVRVRRV